MAFKNELHNINNDDSSNISTPLALTIRFIITNPDPSTVIGRERLRENEEEGKQMGGEGRGLLVIGGEVEEDGFEWKTGARYYLDSWYALCVCAYVCILCMHVCVGVYLVCILCILCCLYIFCVLCCVCALSVSICVCA